MQLDKTYLGKTCIDTIPGDQYLSLHSPIDSSKPTFRRITFDILGDTSSFILKSFYVSTKPIGLRNADYAGIVWCGWTVRDQFNVKKPTFCDSVTLSGSDTFLVKVEIDRADLAFIEVGGVLNYVEPSKQDQAMSAAKGSKPVEFQLDDIEVCVPNDADE